MATKKEKEPVITEETKEPIAEETADAAEEPGPAPEDAGEEKEPKIDEAGEKPQGEKGFFDELSNLLDAKTENPEAVKSIARKEPARAERVLTATDKRSDAGFTLSRSLENKDVIMGRVDGIKPLLGDDGRITYFAQVFFGDYKIVIPESEFTGIISLKERERGYVRNFMESRLGSLCYFIVTTLNLKNKEGIASRKMAEEKRSAIWRTKKADFAPGKTLTGDVVAIHNSAIWVNLAGAETRMPLKDLLWTRIKTPHQDFTVGQPIKLKLLTVSVPDEGYPTFTASHKETIKNPGIEIYDHFLEDSVYTGTLTSMQVKQNGEKTHTQLYVTISITDSPEKKISVLCPPPYGVTPKRGDSVKVKINKKDIKLTENKVYFWGRIVHVNQ